MSEEEIIKYLQNDIETIERNLKEYPSAFYGERYNFKKRVEAEKKIIEELELKDKVIDLFADALEQQGDYYDENFHHKSKEEIKQYFINKAKEEE